MVAQRPKGDNHGGRETQTGQYVYTLFAYLDEQGQTLVSTTILLRVSHKKCEKVSLGYPGWPFRSLIAAFNLRIDEYIPSFAAKIADPITSVSPPASTTCPMVSSLIPPST